MTNSTHVDIRRLRLEKGFAQRDLARLAGLTVPALTRLERGLDPISPEAAKRLERALGTDLDGLEPVTPVSGEGYVTAVPATEIVRRRRKEHDIGLRPVIDLFCGVGGFSAGFEATGEFEVVAGVDLLGDRLDTFTANHAAANAYGLDIRRLATDTLASENPGPFAVIGGPPCQGFSSIRPFRNVEWRDPRNNLAEEFCRVVAALRPDWLVFENVVGLLTHEGGKTYEALLGAFEALGYRVSARVLNAAYHGLPQRRERLLVVGSRRGKAFDWPAPTHNHGRRSMVGRSPLLLVPEPGFLGDTRPAVALMEAIGDLPPVRAGEAATRYPEAPPASRYAEIIRNGAETLTMHDATAHSPAMLEIIRHAGENINCLPPGMVTSGFSSCYSRLSPDEPANTITVNFVHPASNRCIHPFQDRALTPREGARLQGFPDTFVFEGTRSQVVKQIGNAVPPLLGRVIAEAILDAD
jgi:DNA (cytosine-5)-methyltransferase 1